jgi:hypothetical protein
MSNEEKKLSRFKIKPQTECKRLTLKKLGKNGEYKVLDRFPIVRIVSEESAEI